jgi:hypothetical protein
MKSPALIIAALFLCSISIAQNSNYLKIHAGAEFPVGAFSEGYKTGWGIHATDYFEISKGGSISASAGFTSWKAKSGIVNAADLLIVRFGYRAFVSEGFYLQAEPAGIAFHVDKYNNGASYAFGGGIGYLFSSKGKTGTGFDISSKFNRAASRSWISVNLGYQFKL